MVELSMVRIATWGARFTIEHTACGLSYCPSGRTLGVLGQREFNPAGFHRPPYRAATAPSQIGYGPDAIRTKRIDASGRPIKRDGVQ